MPEHGSETAIIGVGIYHQTITIHSCLIGNAGDLYPSDRMKFAMLPNSEVIPGT